VRLPQINRDGGHLRASASGEHVAGLAVPQVGAQRKCERVLRVMRGEDGPRRHAVQTRGTDHEKAGETRLIQGPAHALVNHSVGRQLQEVRLAVKPYNRVVAGPVAMVRGAFNVATVSKVLASVHGASGRERNERRVPAPSPRPRCVQDAAHPSVLVQALSLELLQT